MESHTTLYLLCMKWASNSALEMGYAEGGVKTERVFPGLSVLRKNNKMEVLSPEKWKYYPRKKWKY